MIAAPVKLREALGTAAKLGRRRRRLFLLFRRSPRLAFLELAESGCSTDLANFAGTFLSWRASLVCGNEFVELGKF